MLTLDIDVEAIVQFQNEFGEGSAVCDMSDAAQVEAALIPWSTPTSALMLFNNAGIAGSPATGGRHRGSGVAVDDRYRPQQCLLSDAFGDPADEIPAQRSDSHWRLPVPGVVAQCARPTWQPSGLRWARQTWAMELGLNIRVVAVPG